MGFNPLVARDSHDTAALMGVRPNKGVKRDLPETLPRSKALFESAIAGDYSVRDNNKRDLPETLPRSEALLRSTAGDHSGRDNNNALPRSEAILRGTAGGDNFERDSSNNNININNSIRRPRRTAERRRNLRAICGKGEKFRISSKSFPLTEGCYSQLTQYNGEAMYSPSRENESGNFVVGATQGDASDPYDFRWSLVYADSGNTKESYSMCQSVQSALTTHPANAIWACDISENGELTIVNKKNFSVTCGCSSSSDEDRATPRESLPPTIQSRAVGCGVVFVLGFVTLCSALIWKLFVGRKRSLF